MKIINPQIQKTQQNSSRRNMKKKTTPRHIIKTNDIKQTYTDKKRCICTEEER